MKKFLKIFLISISSLFITFSAFSAPLKVGFVYLTTPGDHGWTYAHERARVILEEKFGDQIETTYALLLKIVIYFYNKERKLK